MRGLQQHSTKTAVLSIGIDSQPNKTLDVDLLLTSSPFLSSFPPSHLPADSKQASKTKPARFSRSTSLFKPQSYISKIENMHGKLKR